MTNRKKCCVPKCSSSINDAVLYRLPRVADEERLTVWLSNINSPDVNVQTAKYLRVCQKHFEPKYIGRRKLKLFAVPTLISLNEIELGVSKRAIGYRDNVIAYADHNYFRKSNSDHTYCKIERTAKGSTIVTDNTSQSNGNQKENQEAILPPAVSKSQGLHDVEFKLDTDTKITLGYSNVTTKPDTIDLYTSQSNGNQKENQEGKQQEPYKIKVVIPPAVSKSQGLHDVELKLNTDAKMASGSPNATTEPDNVDKCTSQSNANQKENPEDIQQEPYKIQVVIPPAVFKSQGLHDVEFKLNTDAKIASVSPNATTEPEIVGDTFADAIKFDDIEISPLPSPLREDSSDPINTGPNNGLHDVVFKLNTDVKMASGSPNATTKPNTVGNSEVFSHLTKPGPCVVSRMPYRTKKLNTEYVNIILTDMTEPRPRIRMDKVKTGHVSVILTDKTKPGAHSVSPVPIRMDKPKTGAGNDPMKNKRMRIMQKYKNLSACCQTIYDKCKVTIAKLKKQLYRAINSAKNKTNINSFENVTNGMPLIIRTFVRMQADMIKNKKKDKRGHRFKENEKLLCLALYTASPTAYKFMSTIFMLPHKKTLCNFGLNIKREADKTATPAEHTDASKTSQEDVALTQTPDVVTERPDATPERPNGVPERGADMPTFEETEASAAVATIAPSAPAPTKPTLSTPTPALSAPIATTHPAHAELIAELKRCLPATPKLPVDGAMLTDERGRFVRRLKRPLVKTTPTQVKKIQMTRSAIIRVFKLAAGTTCEDVVSHVSAIVPHYLVRCQKILTKLKGPAFVLEVPKEYREGVLNPSFWPEGVVTWARGTGLPETMLKIRVFNVAEGTPVSDMVRHISQVVPEDKITCERLESKGGGESFKITMPRKYLRIVAAPTFWPTGVDVARMRTQQSPRKKRMKRESPTDLSLVDDNASKRMKHGGKFRPNVFLNS